MITNLIIQQHTSNIWYHLHKPVIMIPCSSTVGHDNQDFWIMVVWFMAVIILQVGRPHCKEPLADCTGHVIVNMVMLLATMMRLPQAVLIYCIFFACRLLVQRFRWFTKCPQVQWPIGSCGLCQNHWWTSPPQNCSFSGMMVTYSFLPRFGANMCYHPTGYVISGIHVWKLPYSDRWVCFLQNYFWYNGKPNGTTNNGRRKAFDFFGD